MSLVYKHIFSPDTQIAVWKVDEDSHVWGDFLDGISDACTDIYHSINTEKRRKEFLFSRYLLGLLRGKPTAVSYTEHGAPVIDGSFVSISHCDQFVAVAIGTESIGVDIQTLNPKIGRIANKFLSDQEWQYINQNKALAYQTIIWSAKEALYKLDGKGGLIFKTQLKVASFDLDQDQISAEIVREGESRACRLHMKHTDEYHLVIAQYDE